MNVFRLLVLAIAFLALVFVLLNFLPYFFPKQDAFALLSNNLEGAQIVQGKPVFLEIIFGKSLVLQAKNFDSSMRSTAFECNNARVCCNIGEECGLIEWDERSIKFNEEKPVKTATRCFLEDSLFSCKIYFGKAPAQIEIKKINAEKEINLGEKDAVISVEMENAGEDAMLSGELRMNVFKRYFESGAWKKRYSGASSKTIALGELLPGEKTEKQILLEANPGSYELEIIASGQDAGFDKNILSVTLTGERKCVAQECLMPEISEGTGECRLTCYCTGCALGSYCEQRIKARTPEELGLSSGIFLNNLEAIVGSGSNTIQFVLPVQNCS